jgi:hypothetical protein
MTYKEIESIEFKKGFSDDDITTIKEELNKDPDYDFILSLMNKLSEVFEERIIDLLYINEDIENIDEKIENINAAEYFYKTKNYDSIIEFFDELVEDYDIEDLEI